MRHGARHLGGDAGRRSRAKRVTGGNPGQGGPDAVGPRSAGWDRSAGPSILRCPTVMIGLLRGSHLAMAERPSRAWSWRGRAGCAEWSRCSAGRRETGAARGARGRSSASPDVGSAPPPEMNCADPSGRRPLGDRCAVSADLHGGAAAWRRVRHFRNRRCERCQGGRLCPVDLQSRRSSPRPHRRCS